MVTSGSLLADQAAAGRPNIVLYAADDRNFRGETPLLQNQGNVALYGRCRFGRSNWVFFRIAQWDNSNIEGVTALLAARTVKAAEDIINE